MRRLDPLQQALLTCVFIVAAGLVSIALGKRVVARTEDVYDQIPAFISGGLGGIALVLLGCVFAFVQVSRNCSEQERLLQAGVLDEVTALTDVRRRRIAAGAQRVAAGHIEPIEAQAALDETIAIPVITEPAAPRRPRRTRRVAP